VCASYSAVLTFYLTVIVVSARRKPVVIKIEQKLEAVRRIKNGEILRNVAADFGVGLSTISVWVKSKSKLEEQSSKMPNGGTLQLKNVEKKDSN
jgi:cytochrome c biogenesis factor